MTNLPDGCTPSDIEDAADPLIFCGQCFRRLPQSQMEHDPTGFCIHVCPPCYYALEDSREDIDEDTDPDDDASQV